MQNIYHVFVYGDDINEIWKEHRPDYPPAPVTITVQLIGRLKKAGNSYYNNISLRYKQIKFHYQKKSCNYACSPSDYCKGGKCDKMGCYTEPIK